MKLFKNLKNTFEQIQTEIGHIISVVTLSVHIFYKSYYKYVCIFSTVTLNYCEKEQILHYQMTVIRSGWCFQIQTIWNTFCKNLHTSSYFLRKKSQTYLKRGRQIEILLSINHILTEVTKCITPNASYLYVASHRSHPWFCSRKKICYVITSCFQFCSLYHLSDKRDVPPDWSKKSFLLHDSEAMPYSLFEAFAEFLQRNRIFFCISCWSRRNLSLKGVMNVALCKQGSLNGSRFCAWHWHSSSWK